MYAEAFLSYHLHVQYGSDDLKYYGEDTTIAVSKENLTEEIDYSTDVDSIKNCFK